MPVVRLRDDRADPVSGATASTRGASPESAPSLSKLTCSSTTRPWSRLGRVQLIDPLLRACLCLNAVFETHFNSFCTLVPGCSGLNQVRPRTSSGARRPSLGASAVKSKLFHKFSWTERPLFTYRPSRSLLKKVDIGVAHLAFWVARSNSIKTHIVSRLSRVKCGSRLSATAARRAGREM